ncbi:MAG: hypothetical protein E6K81_05550 [Candidatus Eisenbacteria bacterium]|uniref:Zinc finger/thioredoxin putative domain-containing protein n=1 Tax=Eiseniibacteriota bacterium TaxID=2212470 RepID=A0A538UB26_UNCEI|nr:MAG: hypothetical protein E6K81_05550 [Candidatus Eisenbacteria bacterium]
MPGSRRCCCPTTVNRWCWRSPDERFLRRAVMRDNEGRETPEAPPPPPMTVHCPHCSTGYLLPDHLVGPGGARVRCPQCAGDFVVVRDAAGDAAPAPAASAPASGPASPPPAPPEAIAAAVLDDLVHDLGDGLSEARARGHVLSEHGPAILDAYAEYLRRAGPGVTPQAFRLALRDRCGVDLTPRP